MNGSSKEGVCGSGGPVRGDGIEEENPYTINTVAPYICAATTHSHLTLGYRQHHGIRTGVLIEQTCPVPKGCYYFIRKMFSAIGI